jgi:ketosteroid isomerase-like protein
MTKRQFARSALSMLLGSGLVAPVWTEEAMTSDERTIRSLEEQEVVAVLNQDVAMLERLMSDRIIVNNPQNGITPDREGVLDRVRRGLIRYSSFDRRIEAIRIDGDVAIVMGLEIVVPIGDAPRAGETVRRRYTNIWKRTGSGWKSIARHANVVAGPP